MKRFLICLSLACCLLLNCAALAASPEALQGYNAKGRSWQYIQFGEYPTEADGTVKPILWRVLSVKDQQAYLLSEYILFAHRVDPNCYPVNKDTSPYGGWETSELAAYLNSEFLNATFSAEEQAALLVQADGGRVSLPAIDDVKNEKYGFIAQKLRQAQSTAYAKANGLYVYQGAKQYSPYWSRTPSDSKAYAHRRVMDDGKLGYICVEVQNLGVRPSILVDVTKLGELSGEGTAADPFTAALTAVEPPTAPAAEPAVETPADEQPVEEPESAKEPAPAAAPSAGGIDSPYSGRYPELTAEGFLPEGRTEFFSVDETDGLWLYASQDLRVEIVRKESQPAKNRPWRWYEADIYVRPGSDEFLRVFYHDDDPKTKKSVEIVKIAQEHRLVFAMNSDWYFYRVQRNAKKKVMPVGIILRRGEILYDDPAKKLWSTIPNRDILALYPNAGMEVYDYNGITADALKANGAYDVLSFGPVLVSDGKVTAQTLDISARQKDNPRSGIGMVEPGHYVSIIMEGRRKGISVGCTVKEFAELFLQKGCTAAYNLDGGGTASMMFMGEYVNAMGNYAADARKQIEVLGIGQSESLR